MHSLSTSSTIYVGNIQSITDDQLREYFQRFGRVEACYHNCTRTADEWLIDYRFIRFSSDTNMNVILTNKIDHTIGRIRLDIHPYEVVFLNDTRLVLDRKICLAHTDTKLNRNQIKKSFTKFGRILNCTCVSSGNGLEYVYIEYESVNSINPIVANNQHHSVGRTKLAVKKALRPSDVGVKQELISHEENHSREQKYSYSRQRSNPNTEIVQYSSSSINHHNRIIENELQTSNSMSDQLSNISSGSQRSSSITCSQQQLKDYEKEYNLRIRQDLDDVNYRIEKFLQNQKQSYKKIRKFILDEIRSQSTSSSSDQSEVDSRSSSPSKSKVYKHRKSNQ